MFARITGLRVKPENIDRTVNLYRLSVLPAARSQKGFIRTMMLVNGETGESRVITFWETEADAIENEKNLYYQRQLIKFMNLFTAQPVKEGYQVVIDEE